MTVKQSVDNVDRNQILEQTKETETEKNINDKDKKKQMIKMGS